MTHASSAPIAAATAKTLLDDMDRVAGWLAGGERLKGDVRRGVTEMAQRLATDTLSKGVILSFQVNVLRLQSGPLRTLLLRRTGELCALCPSSL